MKKEVWKPILGFPLHEVSNIGNFRRRSSKRILKTQKSGNGYLLISLYLIDKRQQKTISCHKAVLEAFVGPRPHDMQCAHVDGNKQNNRVENLKWATPKENNYHKIRHGTQTYGEDSPKSILKNSDIPEIFYLRKKGMTITQISEIYEVNRSTISLIFRRKNWRKVVNVIYNDDGEEARWEG